jgi:hypothetical protein
VLLFLHVYWFGLFCKILCMIRKTGEGKDLQNNLEEDSTHKKKQ